ncbi:MAG: serine hydrolase domain-containing protein, partial [Bacteroidota bacterium]
MTRTLTFFLICLVLPLIQLRAQDDFDPTALEKYVVKQMKKRHVAALSIAIVDDQKVIWSKGYGMADIDGGKTATAETVYRVGSVSKLFTMLSVMQLVEAGKLDLDRPVKDYLPNFSPRTRFPDAPVITARHLLTHQSGLPSDVLANFFSDNPPPFQQIIQELNQEYVSCPPNTIWAYSNPAFDVLGVLVEKVSGESFFDYTQRHLFSPMDMKQSTFRLADSSQYAMGYHKKLEALAEPRIKDVPAGMMHANVKDLSNFMKMMFAKGEFNGKSVLEGSSIAEMLRPQTADVALDFDRNMGLCWFLTEDKSPWSKVGGMAGHGGDTYVYHADLTILPGQKLGVVALTNSASGEGLVRSVRRRAMLMALKQLRGIENPEDEDEQEDEKGVSEAKTFSDEALNEVAGTYAIGPVPFHLASKGKKLKTNLAGTRFTVHPHKTGGLMPKVKLFGLISIPVKSIRLYPEQINGYDVLVQKEEGVQSLFAVRT